MEYFYEAVDPSGQVVVGKIEGQNGADVQRLLQQAGYSPRMLAPAGATPTQALASLPEPLSVATRADAYVGPSDTLIGTVPAQLHQTSSVAPPTKVNTPSNLVTASRQLSVDAAAVRTGAIVMSGSAAEVAARQSRTLMANRPASVANASTLGGVTPRDLMMFFRQLASLVNSGITVYGALDNLGPRTRNANLSAVAKELADAARNGRRVSQVMAHYPRIFPDHVAGMVAAGETGGFLEIALAEIADGYDRNIALYRGAWIPKLMATQAFFLLFLAQPLFSSIFSQFDMTEGVKLYFKLALFRNLPIALAIYFAAILAARRFQLPQFRHKRDELSLKMPAFGDLQRQTAILAFLKMLSRLYHAGVGPIQAWEGAMNTASNVVIREKLQSSSELMQKGVSLADAFTATGLFTDQVEQLVITGQQSGQVVEMLDQASAYYQQKADEAAGKSRFMMFRFGLLALLVFGGAAFLWLVHTYFAGIFHYVESGFGD